jgi:hypothetical protein
VTFNASESYDPDGKIVSYVWDFGDGNITTVTDAIITHTYSAKGGYIVTSTVIDSIGLKDESSMVVRTAGRENTNGDGKVDMLDISLVIDAFMTYPGDSRWNPRCDVNLDGVVDMLDVSMVI